MMKNFIFIFSILLVPFISAQPAPPIGGASPSVPTATSVTTTTSSGIAKALSDSMGQIQESFKAAVLPWADRMKDVAKSIFLMLIGLDFAWMCIRTILQDNHISQMAKELLNKVFLYGFGWYLISNGDALLNHVFNFFQDSETATASSNAATSGVFSVGRFFDSAITVIHALYLDCNRQAFSFGIISGLINNIAKIALIFGLLIVIVYIASVIIVAYAEMYMTITATIVLFGFFVSDWTRDISQRAIMHSIAMGFKFFTTLLIARIGITAVEQWLTVSNGQTFMNLLIMLSVIVIFALLLVILPTAMAAIISLTSVFSPGDQVATELRSISNRVLIKEPMGQVGAIGVAGSLAVTKAAEAGRPIQMTGGGVGGAVKNASRLGFGTARNLVRAYKDAGVNLFTGKDREMQARANFGQQLSYQMYQRKMDSQVRQDQAQSGGAVKGKEDATTGRAAASEGEDNDNKP